MTIDIQWIRHHPDQVRYWQQCRGLPEATVDQVIQHDQDSRQALHTLRLHRQRLNSIAKELRTDRHNVSLLHERSQLQVLVQELEDQVEEKKLQVETLLETLASPIDTVLLEQYPLLPKDSNFSTKPTSSSRLTSSYYHPLHWYQTNALLWKALEFFGQKYSTRHILPENDGPPPPASSSSVSSSCPSPAPLAADWKDWVSNSMPRKAIYGAKQLPQYTLLQRNINQGLTLECLAMTAGAMWDSRQIQLELATELQTFYQSLVSSISDIHTTIPQIILHALPSHMLDQHELSRICVVAETHRSQQGQHGKQYVLGWVSNFGDALSRAHDIRFRGGGLQEAKEFVYWVRATILSPWTWHHLTTILHGHYANETDSNNQNNHQVVLPAWARCNNPTDVENTSVPATSTTAMLSPPRFTTRLGISNRPSKSSRRMDLTLPSKSAEAISCPFGFLL